MAEIVRIQERLAKSAMRAPKVEGKGKILLFTGTRYERRHSEVIPPAAMAAQLPPPRNQSAARDPASV